MFALSCLFPAQVALALKDCGTHEIVSCETHDDEHFVARHVGETKFEVRVESLGLDPSKSGEEHDSAHQIEKSKQGLATLSKTSNELENTLPLVVVMLNESYEGKFIHNTLWPNAPPDADNSFLSFLPSVRLQV